MEIKAFLENLDHIVEHFLQNSFWKSIFFNRSQLMLDLYTIFNISLEVLK